MLAIFFPHIEFRGEGDRRLIEPFLVRLRKLLDSVDGLFWVKVDKCCGGKHLHWIIIGTGVTRADSLGRLYFVVSAFIVVLDYLQLIASLVSVWRQAPGTLRRSTVERRPERRYPLRFIEQSGAHHEWQARSGSREERPCGREGH